ncbi:DUF2723 domain-containing protein [Pseudomaricurvus alkylphenolicus]|uniref:protein O-mannosyl-transferase family n=1 Tax=Pseudomaricurvus alkylphenolicus TaxID=1306991 RepID=UPI001422A952|nr:DUF2723 domain-containing protein [Pseudomaricurvus alkylphenolicus]NIB40021.1 DUF2723 domain-containing protein [Pseudomaricurvus alkylphenolicus]
MQVHPRNTTPQSLETRSIISAIAVAATLFSLYLLSMPRIVALEDDGLFILSAYFNGVPHPPGYPLHSILSRLAMEIPIGTVTERIHALSGLLAALTCALLVRILMLLKTSLPIAILVSLSFGASQTLWSQAIIAEVYTLNVFLFSILLYLSLRIYQANDEQCLSQLRWLALCYGLAISNHWPLIVLSSPGLFLLLIHRWKLICTQLPVLITLLCLGLSPYLYLYWNSQTNPAISFLGPIDNLREFFYYVLRQNYSQIDASPSAGYLDKINFLWFYLKQLTGEFSLIGFALGVWGAVGLYRNAGYRLLSAICLIIVGNSLLLIALLNFDFDRLMVLAFRVYPLISFLVFSLLIALGLQQLAQIRNHFRTQRLLPTVAAMAILILTLAGSAKVNLRSDYNWTREYASAVFERIEDKGIVFLSGDIQVGVLSFYHLLEQERSDLDLYNPYGLFYANRLFPHDAEPQQRAREINHLINTTRRPIYSDTSFIQGPPKQDLWLIQQYFPGKPDDTMQQQQADSDSIFAATLVNHPDASDAWTNEHQRRLKAGYARSIVTDLARLRANDNSESSLELQQQKLTLLNSLFDNFSVGVAILDQINRLHTPAPLKVPEVLARTLELQQGDEIKSEQATLWLNVAIHLQRMGKHKEAQTMLDKAVSVWRHPQNTAASQFQTAANI